VAGSSRSQSSRSARGISGAEVALAAVVVAVVAMLVVPLPTFLLDILLALNLSISVAILLVVLFVPDALGIATFPTILLITTLFRLALNVSTARLILLQGNAGEVISAFANFVVQGNYIVGAIIFLILTIIQFVVITKGAERVAEVGARFVLDAMPGKQMAIDAELRSGAIDGNEARRRRHKLSRESQFYGSMDGAMKFVKGDVIAALIITVINILGGVAIGTIQKGLPAGMALKKYGLLTIGDGLVSQIPALILSTSAGLLVTRIAAEEPGTPLGNELASQIFGTPKALAIAAVFVALLGVTPGLPTIPFLVMAAALAATAHFRKKRMEDDARRAGSEPLPRRGSEASGDATRFVPMVAPWSVEVSPDLENLLVGGGNDRGLTLAIQDLRDEIFQALGAPLPLPRIRVSTTLKERTYQVAMFEVPARTETLNDTTVQEEVARAKADAKRSAESGQAQTESDTLSESAATTLRIARETRTLLMARAAEFIGLTETQRLLDELEQYAPATVRNVTPKPYSVQLLADIMRRLVEEGVSIRDLRGILEALAQLPGQEKDPLALTEYVRSNLKRAMTHRLTAGTGNLEVVTLDPMIEDSIRRAITRTPAGSYLALAPAVGRDIAAALERVRADVGDRMIVLTSSDIRRFTKKFFEVDFPGLTVVSYTELMPETAIREVGKATLA
jgi:type III secretion protein V